MNFISFRLTGKLVEPAGIEPDKNKKENGKRPEGRASVADKRQGNSDNRHNSNGHSNIYQYMEKEDGGNRVTVNTGKNGTLPFGQSYQPY